MSRNSLQKPIGALMRAVPTLSSEASVGSAAFALREEGSPIVAIVRGASIVGAVTEATLTQALGEGVDANEPVAAAYAKSTPLIRPYATGAEALRAFDAGNSQVLIVIDDFGRPLGMVSPSDLWPKEERPPTPAQVGGMATPFGVYLTTGTVSAGVGNWALLSTGMLLFLVLATAELSSRWLAHQAFHLDWSMTLVSAIANFAPFAFFLLAMRLMPLSGIHGAEHKVVHAIERGEPLTSDIVRRMPRVHPRCGTNIAVGVTLFLGLASADWIPDQSVRTLAALLGTLFLWKPLGTFAQFWITTREPSQRHIQMGIKSGNELLTRYATGGGGRSGIMNRIWNSGMLHVIAGSTLMYGLIWATARAFGFQVFV